MATYCTKPRLKVASQWLGPRKDGPTPTPAGVYYDREADRFFVVTIHGQKTWIEPLDFIVQEPDGVHYYPCKPDIFLAGHDQISSLTTIEGTLEASSADQALMGIAFLCNSLIGVWQLRANNRDDGLMKKLRSLIGQQVTFEGEQIDTIGYGGVFKVVSVQKRSSEQPPVTFKCVEPKVSDIHNPITFKVAAVQLSPGMPDIMEIWSNEVPPQNYQFCGSRKVGGITCDGTTVDIAGLFDWLASNENVTVTLHPQGYGMSRQTDFVSTTQLEGS